MSFKYSSNFIAPLVTAYGSFNTFILTCRLCFTPNLWQLGDRGGRSNGVSCTSHTVALSSCIFFHLSWVSSLLSHRLHHPALIGYTYPSYRNVSIMLTYTYLSNYFSRKRFLKKRTYYATPFLYLLEKLISYILWEKATDRMYRTILLSASWVPDHFLGCRDLFLHYLDLSSLTTFETGFFKPCIYTDSGSVSHLLYFWSWSAV